MKIHRDISLAPILWYRIGGTARLLIEAESADDVLRAAELIEREPVERVLVIGLGSNLVFGDDHFDGAVLRVAGCASGGPRLNRDGLVEAYGGVVLDDAIRLALDRGLTGLEWAGGLPGTVGAGVRGNVGAFGGEIRDSFVEAEVVHVGNGRAEVERLTHADLQFRYRYSRIVSQPGTVVLNAAFSLKPADPVALAEARRVYEANIAYRKARHPLEYPNCGSVFKNIHRPEEVASVLAVWPDVAEKVQHNWHGKVSMGYIIGRLGFAGLQVGGARVSEKHNNFIVNTGGATGRDVREIIRRIQTSATETFGFTPEVEVQLVG